MLDLEKLLDERVQPTADNFQKLITQVCDLHKQEQAQETNFRVDGRLLYLPNSGEAIIIGDLHGDINSLERILKDSGFIERAPKRKNMFLVFMGDYIDRGPASTEVLYLVLKLKVLFPRQIVLMRGNHEGPPELIPIPNDLEKQLKKKYGKFGVSIHDEIRKMFTSFYTAVIVKYNLVIIHGGFPSQASTINDIADAHEKHPKTRHLEEMLWNDFQEQCDQDKPSPRGLGKLCGSNTTDKLLRLLNVNVLVRSHEPCRAGFKTQHHGKVFTLYSSNISPYKNKHISYLKVNLSNKILDTEQLKEQLIIL